MVSIAQLHSFNKYLVIQLPLYILFIHLTNEVMKSTRTMKPTLSTNFCLTLEASKAIKKATLSIMSKLFDFA